MDNSIGKSVNARVVSLLCVISLAMLGNGCASFVKHVSEGVGTANTVVGVNSIPQGAKGMLSTGRVFTTPTNLVLRSDQDYTITLTMQGYDPVTVHLESELNPWVLGNILTLGLGSLTDVEQGANLTLSQTEIAVTFEEEKDDSEEESNDGALEPEAAGQTSA